MHKIRDTARELAEENAPVTLRQVFYLLVAAGLLEKEDLKYTWLCKRVVDWREERIIPWDHIVDNTRHRHARYTFSGLQNAISDAGRVYIRDRWDGQPTYVEIWLEKDALVGTITPVVDEYDVPLVPVRGQASVTFLEECATAIKQNAAGRPVYVYYFGDHDPTGVTIPENIKKRLVEFGCKFTFERVAVTPEQIATMGLLTRPPKSTDKNTARFLRDQGDNTGCAEVDAIPPNVLRQMVRDCIERHLDRSIFDKILAEEIEEKALLDRLADRTDEDDGVEWLEDVLDELDLDD